MKMVEINGVSWWKSSVSNAADCLAVRELGDDRLAMCNSRDPGAGVIVTERQDMADLLARAKAGAFDALMDGLG